MATELGDLTLEEAAREAAGNWRHFDCFSWFRQHDLDRPDDWAILYTHHRDSGLLDQSNAAVIAEALEPFTDRDVVFESHNHWAVGHVDGFSIRIYRRGKITKAFRVYHELAERMASYPILDESDYSDKEYESTLENIPLAAWRLKNNYDLPDDWVGDVYSWLSEYRCSALENTSDQGGWPDEDDLEAVFDALGYQRSE
jgi:hypothetical protein